MISHDALPISVVGYQVEQEQTFVCSLALFFHFRSCASCRPSPTIAPTATVHLLACINTIRTIRTQSGPPLFMFRVSAHVRGVLIVFGVPSCAPSSGSCGHVVVLSICSFGVFDFPPPTVQKLNEFAGGASGRERGNGGRGGKRKRYLCLDPKQCLFCERSASDQSRYP